MSGSISVNSVMKSTLKEATDKFEVNLNSDEGGTTNPPAINPVTMTNHGQFLRDRGSKISWEMYITYPYLLWDPFSQYQPLFLTNKLNCPLCAEDGVVSTTLLRSGEWYNGRLTRLNPRVIFGTNSLLLLVSAVYKCSRGHEVSACHPNILEVVKLNAEIPFFLTHKHGFTLQLANLAEELIDNGLSFKQVKNTIYQQYKNTYDRFAASFWRDMALSKSQGVSYDDADVFFPSFSSEIFPHPSANLLTDVFLKRFFHNEPDYKNAMQSLTANNWITCDHTFKSVCNIGYTRSKDGKWINQYNSVFCVLNEKGEVLNWQFTATEGFEEVKELFLELKNKLEPDTLKLICIDNCCKWNRLLRDIFPKTMVKQDLFHAVQRFCKSLKKRDPIHRELSNDYGKVFRHPRDTGDERKMHTPDQITLSSNIDNFLKKWKDREHNGIQILNNERLHEIHKIREHVMKACLSDIPPHCSTSLNERLHKDMKKLLCKNRIGVQLAFAKFTRYFFRHNQQRGQKESIQSLKAKNLKDICCGENEIPDVRGSACFGIRTKNTGSKDTLTMNEQGQNEENPIIALSQVTLGVIQDASDAITCAEETERNGETNLPGTQSPQSVINRTSCAAILQHALAIFKVMLLVKNKWSSRSINLLKIPFLFQTAKEFMQCDVLNRETEVQCEGEHARLENVVSSFGFSIVPTDGDGNCFFTSVAFQLQQILSDDQCTMEQRLFLESLGVTLDVTVDELSSVLRELVVNEWLNNQQEYRSFFEDINLQEEIDRFRRSGEFAGPLGDALPMGMANVLKIPILILTTVHNMPIVSVAPRTSSNNPIALWLCYTQQGPGHYDALVAQVNSDEGTNDSEPNEMQTGKNTG